jgi:CRP/FNR family transcriptional regulator, cyclic AMP receptor protein
MVVSPAHRPRHDAAGSLLELDPELGCLLGPERRQIAQRELQVRLSAIDTGAWDASRLEEADPAHFGLLVIDGVLAREVVLHSMVSTELLGAGDIVRPWRIEGAPHLLPVSVRWNALAPVRVALLERRLAAQLGGYPEIGAVIVDRLSERAQRLAVTQAISQLNKVEDRLVALFWHLAERWGRVATDGVALPLALSHRLIGELVGARRPTVSTALGELARQGTIVRRDDGTWLLAGEAPAPLPSDPAEVIRQRRRLMPPEPAPERAAAAAPMSQERPAAAGPMSQEHRDELRASLAAAKETTLQRGREFEALQQEATALRTRTLELRRERAARMERLRNAALSRR